LDALLGRSAVGTGPTSTGSCYSLRCCAAEFCLTRSQRICERIASGSCTGSGATAQRLRRCWAAQSWYSIPTRTGLANLRVSARACLTRRVAGVTQSAALWIFLAPYSRGVIVPLSTLPAPWNPFEAFRDQRNTAWAIVAARVVGGATILPVMEEVRRLGTTVHAASQARMKSWATSTVELSRCLAFVLARDT
jgi:hypothetical protein